MNLQPTDTKNRTDSDRPSKQFPYRTRSVRRRRGGTGACVLGLLFVAATAILVVDPADESDAPVQVENVDTSSWDGSGNADDWEIPTCNVSGTAWDPMQEVCTCADVNGTHAVFTTHEFSNKTFHIDVGCAACETYTHPSGVELPLLAQDDGQTVSYFSDTMNIVSTHTHCCPELAVRHIPTVLQDLWNPCICTERHVWYNATCTPCPGNHSPVSSVYQLVNTATNGSDIALSCGLPLPPIPPPPSPPVVAATP